jgi:hypothetical protein
MRRKNFGMAAMALAMPARTYALQDAKQSDDPAPV